MKVGFEIIDNSTAPIDFVCGSLSYKNINNNYIAAKYAAWARH